MATNDEVVCGVGLGVKVSYGPNVITERKGSPTLRDLEWVIYHNCFTYAYSFYTRNHLIINEFLAGTY